MKRYERRVKLGEVKCQEYERKKCRMKVEEKSGREKKRKDLK